MSNLWLALALVGTFLTIFLVGVIVDMLMREKRRPVTLLESAVGEVTDSVDLRQEELEGSRQYWPADVVVGIAIDLVNFQHCAIRGIRIDRVRLGIDGRVRWQRPTHLAQVGLIVRIAEGQGEHAAWHERGQRG